MLRYIEPVQLTKRTVTSIDHKDRIDAIELLNLSDDDAAQWLKEHAYSEESLFFSNPEQELHKVVSFAFSRRGSTRIRLAVARYGSHTRTLKQLFADGTKGERLAVLSNPFIGPQTEGGLFRSHNVLTDADAMSIFQRYQSNIREFAVFVSNPNIDRDWLADTIKGWSKNTDLEDDGLRYLVHFLVDNPVISSRRDETLMDGWAEYSYGRLNNALADLLQTAPVTPGWADVLSRMLNKLYLSYTPDFDVNLIDKWKDPEPTDDGERFYFTYLREQITKYLIVRDHRGESKEKYTIDHDDPAVRKGLYSSLPPYELFKGIPRPRDFHYPSFRYLEEIELNKAQQQFVNFCKKCFERDKNDFVEGLVWNDHFWKTKEEREFLSDISWSLAEDPHSSMDVPNLYKAREQYYLEHNPSFFQDDELIDIPFEDTVEGKLSRLQTELDKLRDEIKSQSLEDLADQQRSHFESIIEDTQYQIRRLSDNVSDKTDELARTIAQGSLAQQFKALEARIRRQGGLIWLLIIVLILMWFLGAK